MKRCESCGMPFKHDPSGQWGGTNKDGSINDQYCSLCYTNGEFNYKWDDVKEFVSIVEANMKKSWYSWFMRKMAAWTIPHLPRWKKN